MPFLTICTAPKPFTNPHIGTIQRNAIRSWRALGEDIAVLLVGEEEGVEEAAREMSVGFEPEVNRNPQGTPVVRSMFERARSRYESPLIACVNTDILLLPDFLEGARQVAKNQVKFLIVGQRWDLDVREMLDFSPGWEELLQNDLQKRGRLHPPGGSDYFIFPNSCFQEMPALVIGRAGWDNWMIYKARQQGWLVVDATDSINIIHQDHDYSHLPDCQPHYRLPETAENVRLGGGNRTIFTLLDCNRSLKGDKLEAYPFSWRKFWREVEIFPLVKLQSKMLAELFYAIFHPIKAYREFRSWLRARNTH